MSKHHREHNWAPALASLAEDEIVTEEPRSSVWENLIKEGIRIADDHTHMLSVVDFAHNLNKELEEKGRDLIVEPTAEDLIAQANSAGVSNMLEVGCEYPDWEPTISFAKKSRRFCACSISSAS